MNQAMAPTSPTESPQNAVSATPLTCFLSSPFLHLPFFPPPRPSSKPHLLDQTAPDESGTIQSQLFSAADRCIRAFSTVTSENPFLKSLLSLRSFCQIRCRNPRIGNSLSAHNFAAILPGDSVAGLVVANGLSNFLNLYNTLLVVRLVLTWFPNSPPAIVSPLSTLCDPYLNIFRGIIPPLGGLDLSPILAFLVLNAFTSTAAALPAELPVTMVSQQDISSFHPKLFNLTTMQKKWMRRVCSKNNKNSEDVH